MQEVHLEQNKIYDNLDFEGNCHLHSADKWQPLQQWFEDNPQVSMQVKVHHRRLHPPQTHLESDAVFKVIDFIAGPGYWTLLPRSHQDQV